MDWGEWRDYSVIKEDNWSPIGLIKVVKNNWFTVQFYKQDNVDHLMVRRHDDEPIRSWSDMQRIKNELVSKNRVGIEIYPTENDKIDRANVYHLWVMPEGFKFPFSLNKWCDQQKKANRNIKVGQDLVQESFYFKVTDCSHCGKDFFTTGELDVHKRSGVCLLDRKKCPIDLKNC